MRSMKVMNVKYLRLWNVIRRVIFRARSSTEHSSSDAKPLIKQVHLTLLDKSLITLTEKAVAVHQDLTCDIQRTS